MNFNLKKAYTFIHLWLKEWQSHCLFIITDSCKNAAVLSERPVTHFADRKDKSDFNDLATGNLCHFCNPYPYFVHSHWLIIGAGRRKDLRNLLHKASEGGSVVIFEAMLSCSLSRRLSSAGAYVHFFLHTTSSVGLHGFTLHYLPNTCGRRSGLMVSALDSGVRAQSLSPG